MEKRASGILLHISSLPSRCGIGDLGQAAYDFADFLEESGQRYWQILPLNPTDGGSSDSPYSSPSTFAGNPLFISPELLEDDGLLDSSDTACHVKEEEDLIDYDAVRQHKLGMLAKAFKRFVKASELKDMGSFCLRNAFWLDDHALFTVLKAHHGGKSWIEWPEKYRDRDPEALECFRKANEEEILREKFFQFTFDEQWSRVKKYCNEKGIKIIGDLPIYVSYDSADVWSHPGIFKLDEKKRPYAVAGVPPDYFSSTGQLWGNPVYRWDVLKGSRYDWWLKRFSSTFRKYDIVRIDHFRGLVQYWEVPSTEPNAVKGSWQDVPTYDFFDRIKWDFPHFPVIAEDLGVITDDVKDAKRHYGLPGMKILMFAFGEDDPSNPYLPHNYERNCIVYTGTHDNNTLQGWMKHEAPETDKARLFRYLGEEGDEGPGLNWKVIRIAMMSVADTVIVPVQDVLSLGSKARMNQPSKASGNWKWRLKPGQLKTSYAKKLKDIVMTYGRA